MKRLLCAITAALLLSPFAAILMIPKDIRDIPEEPIVEATIETIPETEPIVYDIQEPTAEVIEYVEIESEPVERVEEEPACPFTYYELELITLITTVESGGECEEGQRLVIDTVLNRLDIPDFADTVEGVIWEGYAAELMDYYDVRIDIYELVLEEVACRSNYDVIYFTSVGYSSYGTPLFQVGNHYFSSF